MAVKINFSLTDEKYNFKSEEDFINWSFSNIKEVENNDFSFFSEINDIDIKKMENVILFLKYYLKVKKSCDKGMDKYNLSLRQLSDNEELKKALLEFVRMNDNGKFLRAMMVALGYHTTGKKDDRYLDLALAVEVFQTSILIHDDIIDNADVRRGKDTIPVSYKKMYGKFKSHNFIEKRNKFADSMALCVGDLGFYLAEELITNGYKDCKNLSDILSYYHQVAIKTCLGEMIDITLPFKEEFFETDKNLESKIMDVYRLKTAWYSVIGPFCLGLTLGDAAKEQITKMEQILLNVGIAFQIKDDLLGIYGDDKVLGKSTNSDIQEFKQTLLYSYTMKTKYKEELLEYYGKEDLTSRKIDKVKDIFDKSGAKKYAEDIMNKLFSDSLDQLHKEKWISEKYQRIISGFIIYLANRIK